ncbi:MAG: helix-turn-helix transcriptional regulator [Lentisphaeria bacterium]|nr:helix-turn-helix transcriptional regulator [Lentisphaeria bacterium]
MKSVVSYDWKLDFRCPVSWVLVTNSGSGGRSLDMHSAIHLGIVISGTHIGRYGNSEITLQRSEVYLTSPWEPHCTLSGSEVRQILLINLDDVTLENFFFTGQKKLAAIFAMPPVERMQYINQTPGRELLLEKAVTLCNEPDTAEKSLRMYNLVLEFFIGLLPQISAGGASDVLQENRLRPALQTLGCKLVSVDDAAKLCNLSSSRFAVLFKSVFGMSFARYERLFRLNGARDDLRQGASLKEAAGKWSFCDKSHLARLLKKYH